VSFIKMFGIGLGLAVLMDATVVRAFLVPAFMRLAGDANWWAPGPLRRLHDRIGISESDQPGPRGTGPGRLDVPQGDDTEPDLVGVSSAELRTGARES
jgi:RND superfamily putative drug exporter